MKSRKQLTVREPFYWSDIYSLRFVVQVIFSGIILCFCFFQLTRGDEKDKNDALYWSCVSGILALWMPSPSSKPSSTDAFYFEANPASNLETHLVETHLELPVGDRPTHKKSTDSEPSLNGVKSDR